jgi:drug/metabolite transporter (DMT)-like permease
MNILPGLLGLAFAFCIGTSDFVSRRSSQSIGPYNTWTYTAMIGSLGLIALSPFLQVKVNLDPRMLLTLFLASGSHFLGGNLLYRAYQHTDFSIVAPLIYCYPGVTVLLAVAFLGQTLSIAQIAALAGTIMGVLLLSTRISDIRQSMSGKKVSVVLPGVRLAAIAAVFFGFNYFGLGIVVPVTGAFFPAIFSRTFSFLAGFLFGPLLKQDVRPERKKFSRAIFLMALLGTVGTLSINFGILLAGGSLPVVITTSSVGAAFVVGYATVLLHERPEKIQILGIILAIVGVAALLYLSP